MALNAAIQFEIRQAGSDTNGGGFKAGATGTDWSQQNAAQYALTNGGATTGSATITTVSAAADMVGNVVYVSGGTGSIAANWYEIISQVTGTSITLDRSTGLVTGTGVTLNIGGALATPGVLASVAGGLGGQLVAGHVVWIKYAATAYACSTSTSGPAGPCALPTVILRIRGYDASRGDATGNMPSYQWTAAAPGSLTYLFSSAGTAHISVENVQANGNSVNNVGGFSLASRASATGCIATNCIGTLGTGFNAAGSPTTFINCKAVGCLTGFAITATGQAFDCWASGCTTGFNSYNFLCKCLASGGATGFTNNSLAANCTADSCSTSGFTFTGVFSNVLVNCVASNSAGTGFTLGANSATLINCASYNNVTIASGTPLVNIGPFASGSTLTSLGADPYVSQAGSDFRPNASSPGGAQIRAAGIGVFGQTDSADIGADQHTDPAAGGGPFGGFISMP